MKMPCGSIMGGVPARPKIQMDQLPVVPPAFAGVAVALNAFKAASLAAITGCLMKRPVMLLNCVTCVWRMPIAEK